MVAPDGLPNNGPPTLASVMHMTLVCACAGKTIASIIGRVHFDGMAVTAIEPMPNVVNNFLRLACFVLRLFIELPLMVKALFLIYRFSCLSCGLDHRRFRFI